MVYRISLSFFKIAGSILLKISLVEVLAEERLNEKAHKKIPTIPTIPTIPARGLQSVSVGIYEKKEIGSKFSS
jgi:hypothetical protein